LNFNTIINNSIKIYKNMREIDIEELNKKFNNIINKTFPIPTENDLITFKPLVEELSLIHISEPTRQVR
jgi:hypothetical protein